MTDSPVSFFKIPESVLVVIHSPNLDVLLIERADRPGFWQSVTGSKDRPDEPLMQTAIREVAEETGIVISKELTPAGPHQSTGAVIDRDSSEACVVGLAQLRDWQLSNVYDIYPVWRHRYAPGVTRNIEHVFSLQVPHDVPIVLSAREHLQHCWLPYREAADKCFSPSNAEAILQLPKYTG